MDHQAPRPEEAGERDSDWCGSRTWRQIERRESEQAGRLEIRLRVSQPTSRCRQLRGLDQQSPQEATCRHCSAEYVRPPKNPTTTVNPTLSKPAQERRHSRKLKCLPAALVQAAAGHSLWRGGGLGCTQNSIVASRAQRRTLAGSKWRMHPVLPRFTLPSAWQ